MSRKNKKTDVFKHIDMSGGTDACWPWLGSVGGVSQKMRDGTQSMSSKARPYFTVDGRKYVVTRLIWELVHGDEPAQGELMCHTCDNSLCCNPAHLTIGTHNDNMDEMVERDRHGLSHTDVRRIRVLLARGQMTHAEIADLMDTSSSTVGRISRDELHTHVSDYPS